MNFKHILLQVVKEYFPFHITMFPIHDQHAANFVFPGRNSEAGKSFERIQFFTGFTQKQRTIKITQIVLISQSSSETVEAVLCRI